MTREVSGGRVCRIVEGVGQPLRRGEQDLVVAVDLGNAGAVQAAAHPWVPERGPGRHRLVMGEGQEAGGQLPVYWALKPDGFEHRPVGVGDQPPEAFPGQLLAGGLNKVRAPQLPRHRNRPVGSGRCELADCGAHLLGHRVTDRLPILQRKSVAVN